MLAQPDRRDDPRRQGTQRTASSIAINHNPTPEKISRTYCGYAAWEATFSKECLKFGIQIGNAGFGREPHSVPVLPYCLGCRAPEIRSGRDDRWG
jgi:hypothetical protein